MSANSMNEELWRLVFQCAGAATRPLLEDNPHYVFPSDRVADAVREVMIAEGFVPPVGYLAPDTRPVAAG